MPGAHLPQGAWGPWFSVCGSAATLQGSVCVFWRKTGTDRLTCHFLTVNHQTVLGTQRLSAQRMERDRTEGGRDIFVERDACLMRDPLRAGKGASGGVCKQVPVSLAAQR